MQNVLALVSDRLSHLTGKRKKIVLISAFGHGSYYSYVIHDVFLLFTFAKVEVIASDALVSDQCLALLHVLYINQASDQILVSAKDNDQRKVTNCLA